MNNLTIPLSKISKKRSIISSSNILILYNGSHVYAKIHDKYKNIPSFPQIIGLKKCTNKDMIDYFNNIYGSRYIFDDVNVMIKKTLQETGNVVIDLHLNKNKRDKKNKGEINNTFNLKVINGLYPCPYTLDNFIHCNNCEMITQTGFYFCSICFSYYCVNCFNLHDHKLKYIDTYSPRYCNICNIFIDDNFMANRENNYDICMSCVTHDIIVNNKLNLETKFTCWDKHLGFGSIFDWVPVYKETFGKLLYNHSYDCTNKFAIMYTDSFDNIIYQVLQNDIEDIKKELEETTTEYTGSLLSKYIGDRFL